MAPKRLITEVDDDPSDHSDNSAPSTTTSRLAQRRRISPFPSNSGAHHRHAQARSPTPSSEPESESEESSVISSSSSSSVTSSLYEAITATVAANAAAVNAAAVYILRQRSQHLRQRLDSFLPQLREANRMLDEEEAAGRGFEINDDDDEEGEDGDEDEKARRGPVVEMNLGLGVLEEKRADGEGESEASSEGEEGEGGETDVLGRLMGVPKEERRTRRSSGAGVGIEELGE